MLEITIPGDEFWDDEAEVFVYPNSVVLELEHSLVSLSKWEAKYEKPFLGPDEKSTDEVLGYIQAMVVTPNFDPDILQKLTQENLNDIDGYINRKMSATWFNDATSGGGSREIITAELIRWWMMAYNVPVEYETWHLNQLFTVIKIANLKQQEANDGGKKRSRLDDKAISDRRALNAKRLAEMRARSRREESNA